MNKATLVLIGVFAVFSVSWFGMVWGPASQQAALEPVAVGSQIYPRERVGEAKQGAEVYRENGCYQCHSQQVRQGKVLYDIQLTGLGDDPEALKAMMARNDLDYKEYQENIEFAYQFKDAVFLLWFDSSFVAGLAVVESMATAVKKGSSEEAKEAAEVLENPAKFFEDMIREGDPIKANEALGKVLPALNTLGDPAVVQEVLQGLGQAMGAASAESKTFLKLRDKVPAADRLLVARLSGLITKNAKAARAFFGVDANDTKLADSISLLGNNRLPWSDLERDHDAKTLLAAVKGVGATANTRAYKDAIDNDPMWSDVGRNWGKRRSVPLDYLFNETVMLGSRRHGPDLADIGSRKFGDTKAKTIEWHYKHLYSPRSEREGSVMPPFTYLFERRELAASDAAPAELKRNHPDGFEMDGAFIIPKPAARQLVAYLLSLRQEDLVPEAPTPAMDRVASKPEKEGDQQ